MNIQVRLSAGLAYATGQTCLTLALPTGATVAEALTAITTQHPSLAGRLQRALPILAGQHAEASTPLVEGAELLVVLAFLGGIAWLGRWGQRLVESRAGAVKSRAR